MIRIHYKLLMTYVELMLQQPIRSILGWRKHKVGNDKMNKLEAGGLYCLLFSGYL
jgi:hypothetical protein